MGGSARTTLAADELVAWTNEGVGAKFQRLRGVRLVAELPRNIAGKTLKTELRKAYLTETR